MDLTAPTNSLGMTSPVRATPAPAPACSPFKGTPARTVLRSCANVDFLVGCAVESDLRQAAPRPPACQPQKTSLKAAVPGTTGGPLRPRDLQRQHPGRPQPRRRSQPQRHDRRPGQHRHAALGHPGGQQHARRQHHQPDRRRRLQAYPGGDAGRDRQPGRRTRHPAQRRQPDHSEHQRRDCRHRRQQRRPRPRHQSQLHRHSGDESPR